MRRHETKTLAKAARASGASANPISAVKSKPDQEPQKIRAMFAQIAERYDLLNHLLSANTDVVWRKRTADECLTGNETAILDVACGTGDLALEIATRVGPDVHVVGADFTGPMLTIAHKKAGKVGQARIPWIEADGLKLPFKDQSFDLVTVAFGIRNMQSLTGALKEMRRVLRPGGRVAILEFTKPDNIIVRSAYIPYFMHVLPRIGALLSQKSAYLYLPCSVMNFPNRWELARTMQKSGFVRVRHCPLSFGIAALHIAERPRRSQK